MGTGHICKGRGIVNPLFSAAAAAILLVLPPLPCKVISSFPTLPLILCTSVRDVLAQLFVGCASFPLNRKCIQKKGTLNKVMLCWFFPQGYYHSCLQVQIRVPCSQNWLGGCGKRQQGTSPFSNSPATGKKREHIRFLGLHMQFSTWETLLVYKYQCSPTDLPLQPHLLVQTKLTLV